MKKPAQVYPERAANDNAGSLSLWKREIGGESSVRSKLQRAAPVLAFRGIVRVWQRQHRSSG